MQQKTYLAIWYFFHGLIENTNIPYTNDTCFLIKMFTKNTICKVEFIQPSNWLYSVPNFLVIQHLVTLYLGGFDVRVVSEIE